MSKILVIEDDLQNADFLKDLFSEGHIVNVANSYEDAKILIVQNKYDIVICDYYLGEKNGIDIMRDFNKELFRSRKYLISGFPTLEMLSKAYSLGVIQFYRKPFNIENIEAMLSTINSGLIFFELGSCKISINLELLEVTYNKESYQLTDSQVLILRCLLEKKGEVFSRKEYIDLFTDNETKSENALDMQISDIKKRAPFLKDLIKNVRGVGYYI